MQRGWVRVTVLVTQGCGPLWVVWLLLLFVFVDFFPEPLLQKCPDDLADRLVLFGRLDLDGQVELAGDSDGDAFFPFHLLLLPDHYVQPVTHILYHRLRRVSSFGWRR